MNLCYYLLRKFLRQPSNINNQPGKDLPGSIHAIIQLGKISKYKKQMKAYNPGRSYPSPSTIIYLEKISKCKHVKAINPGPYYLLRKNF